MSQRPLGLRIAVRLLTTVALCWGLVGASLAVFAQPASAAPGPFTCQPVFYQVDSGQLGVVNPVTGVTTPIGVQNDWYNGIGYNTADNYIYGFGTGQSNMAHLLKIANDGSITDLGIPAGLPVTAYFIGSFDASGNLIAGSGFGYYSVNVTTNTATALPVPVANAGSDIAIVNGVGYSVSGQTLTSINLSTFAVTTAPVTGLPAVSIGYGSAWKDGSNNIYFRDNSSGSIFQVSNYATATPSAGLAITGPPTGNNDGTNCPTAPSPFTPPAAVNDAYTTPYQTALNVPAPGVLTNDSGISITVTANTNPAHGTVTVNADGSFVYTPAAGFSGPDTFTYTITDFFGRTATATVTITVAPPVPAPTTTTTTTTAPVVTTVPVVVEGKTVTAATPVVAAGTLPRTGSSSVLFTLIGLSLILMGLGLSVFSGKSRFFKLPELATSEAQRDGNH